MKIGILYIGIARYACFWTEFHDSCESLFAKDAEKHYYVFTDKEEEIASGERVEVFHQDDMGWPCNSLLRFKMFRRIKDRLADNDYLFFFNSNAKFVKPVAASDILPQDEDFSALCMETSPNSINNESRHQSAAYVPRGAANAYFSGALNGGKATPYLELIARCDEMVDTDLRNGIMPVWHDESVLNAYLFGKTVRRLSREMGKPANWSKPKNAKIILRTKENTLGRSWLRQYKNRPHTDTWFRKLLKKTGITH